MNTVAVKGRIFAEVVATHYTVGGANPTGGKCVMLGERLQLLQAQLANRSFVRGREVDAGVLALLKELNKLCKAAAHPTGIPPTDRPKIVHAICTITSTFRPPPPPAPPPAAPIPHHDKSELEEYFAALKITDEHAAQFASAGITLLTDLKDATEADLIEEGVGKFVARKVLRELPNVSAQ